MKVLISGGGIAGLTLALKLLQQQVDVVLLEKNTAPSAKYKGELLQPKSLAILKDLGVIERILESGHRIDRTVVKELGLSKLGLQQAELHYGVLKHEFPYALMIPHEQLKQILLEACLKLSPTFYQAGVKLISLGPLNHPIKTEAIIERNGQIESIKSDFFVGAEGKISPVRKSLRIRLRKKAYNHQFLTVSFSKPPTLTDATILTKQRYFLGLFPLPNDRVRSVYLIKPDEYKEIIREGLDSFYQRYIDLMPEMEGYVNQINSFKDIQLMIPEGLHTDRYVRGNAVIIGDAAHSVHPMAGEGMNLAIQDADILGDLLHWMNEQGLSDPRYLRRYEQVRKARVQLISSLSNQSAQVYSFHHALWRRFRIKVLQTIQRNDRLHFKQILNISGLGAWRETLFDRLSEVGFIPPLNLPNEFDQEQYFYDKKQDYPWRKC